MAQVPRPPRRRLTSVALLTACLLGLAGPCAPAFARAWSPRCAPGAPTATWALRRARSAGALRLAPWQRREVSVQRSATAVDQEEKVRAVLTTLLQKAGKAEDIIKAGGVGRRGDGSLEFDEFVLLMEKLEVECTAQEARGVFDEIDMDGSGSLEPMEFRKRLRSSGIITDLYSSSLNNVALTVVSAVLLALGFGVFKGASAGIDFVTGYVVEDSLSVDNLFVFLLLFKYFKIPPGLQKFCLDLGIFGAVVLRAAFIFGGLALVKAFKPFLLLFSGFLLYTSYTALTAAEDDDDEEEGPPDAVQSVLKLLPTTDKFDGDKLFVESASGGLLATPLALCIIAVELSDILFAVDSVPAIFAITDDPVIIYTSNIAAIVGLRSLYQVLSIAVQDLAYLDKAVAVVLGFVGLKLGAEVGGFEISSFVSLFVILFILAVGIGASLKEENTENQKETSDP